MTLNKIVAYCGAEQEFDGLTVFDIAMKAPVGNGLWLPTGGRRYRDPGGCDEYNTPLIPIDGRTDPTIELFRAMMVDRALALKSEQVNKGEQAIKNLESIHLNVSGNGRTQMEDVVMHLAPIIEFLFTTRSKGRWHSVGYRCYCKERWEFTTGPLLTEESIRATTAISIAAVTAINQDKITFEEFPFKVTQKNPTDKNMEGGNKEQYTLNYANKINRLGREAIIITDKGPVRILDMLERTIDFLEPYILQYTSEDTLQLLRDIQNQKRNTDLDNHHQLDLFEKYRKSLRLAMLQLDKHADIPIALSKDIYQLSVDTFDPEHLQTIVEAISNLAPGSKVEAISNLAPGSKIVEAAQPLTKLKLPKHTSPTITEEYLEYITGESFEQLQKPRHNPISKKFATMPNGSSFKEQTITDGQDPLTYHRILVPIYDKREWSEVRYRLHYQGKRLDIVVPLDLLLQFGELTERFSDRPQDLWDYASIFFRDMSITLGHYFENPDKVLITPDILACIDEGLGVDNITDYTWNRLSKLGLIDDKRQLTDIANQLIDIINPVSSITVSDIEDTMCPILCDTYPIICRKYRSHTNYFLAALKDETKARQIDENIAHMVSSYEVNTIFRTLGMYYEDLNHTEKTRDAIRKRFEDHPHFIRQIEDDPFYLYLFSTLLKGESAADELCAIELGVSNRKIYKKRFLDTKLIEDDKITLLGKDLLDIIRPVKKVEKHLFWNRISSLLVGCEPEFSRRYGQQLLYVAQAAKDPEKAKIIDKNFSQSISTTSITALVSDLIDFYPLMPVYNRTLDVLNRAFSSDDITKKQFIELEIGFNRISESFKVQCIPEDKVNALYDALNLPKNANKYYNYSEDYNDIFFNGF